MTKFIETVARYHDHKMIIDYTVNLSSTGKLEFSITDYNKLSKDLIKQYLKDILTLDTMINMKSIICPTKLLDWQDIAKTSWNIENRLTKEQLDLFPLNYIELYNFKKTLLSL